MLNSNEIPLSDICLIISDIHCLLETSPICKVFFVPRKANMVAHSLAKFGLYLEHDRFWLEEVPPCVASTVLGDLPG